MNKQFLFDRCLTGEAISGVIHSNYILFQLVTTQPLLDCCLTGRADSGLKGQTWSVSEKWIMGLLREVTE